MLATLFNLSLIPPVALADHRRVQPSAVAGNGGAGAAGTLSAGKLVMPLDLAANYPDVLASITTCDVKALKQWDGGWREKLSTDLSLLAGSPVDVYKHYT